MSGEVQENVWKLAREADLRNLASVINTFEQRFAAMQILMDEHDLRYQQRFAASQEALIAALAAQKEAVAAALLAADRAVTKAELATDKRFEGVNEFRQQLADQAATFMPRAETEIRLGTLSDALAADRGTRREGSQATYGYLLAAASLCISIVVAVVLVIHG